MEPSDGGSDEIDGIPSTENEFEIVSGTVSIIDGDLSGTITGLRRMDDDVLTYRELFVTIVCGGIATGTAEEDSNSFSITAASDPGKLTVRSTLRLEICILKLF